MWHKVHIHMYGWMTQIRPRSSTDPAKKRCMWQHCTLQWHVWRCVPFHLESTITTGERTYRHMELGFCLSICSNTPMTLIITFLFYFIYWPLAPRITTKQSVCIIVFVCLCVCVSECCLYMWTGVHLIEFNLVEPKHLNTQPKMEPSTVEKNANRISESIAIVCSPFRQFFFCMPIEKHVFRLNPLYAYGSCFVSFAMT